MELLLCRGVPGATEPRISALECELLSELELEDSGRYWRLSPLEGVPDAVPAVAGIPLPLGAFADCQAGGLECGLLERGVRSGCSWRWVAKGPSRTALPRMGDLSSNGNCTSGLAARGLGDRFSSDPLVSPVIVDRSGMLAASIARSEGDGTDPNGESLRPRRDCVRDIGRPPQEEPLAVRPEIHPLSDSLGVRDRSVRSILTKRSISLSVGE